VSEELPEGLYVYLEVSDTGSGIADEALDRLFDPFFTTKFGGRGLGLAATLGIVRTSRGTIKVTSEKGKGTTFRILFPAVAPEAAAKREDPPATLWRGTGTVMLVDDEEAVLTIGGQMLEFLGFRVLSASNGRDAIELFKAHSDRIVGVILDLVMPVMDGEETLRGLRQLKTDVPVILSSGYTEEQFAGRFPNHHTAGFIQKPYELKTLSAKLKEVLHG
jgi:CheY-like chemotaxis protein